jgi:multidrug efflux system membrane fusion protein
MSLARFQPDLRKKAFAALVAVPVVGAAAWIGLNPSAPTRAATASEVAVPVGTAIAARADLPVRLSGVGTVQAFNAVTVRPQVDGQLLQVLFTEGQTVHAGDILAQIDPRSYQAALAQAQSRKAQDEAQLRNIRSQVERNATLVAKQYVARQAYDTLVAQADQLEAAIKGDEAAIDAAKIQLGYTTIRAPIGGRVGIRQVDPGNIVHSSTDGGGSSGGGSSDSTIVMITQLQPISAVFTLPQEDLPRLLRAKAKGQIEIALFGRGGSDSEALDHGQLQVIDNQVDSSTGTVRLKATLPNSAGLLWPGQFITAELQVDSHANAVTIPAMALQRGARGNDYVYVVGQDGIASPRDVVAGATDGDRQEVTKGLDDGETVVVSGHYRLRPGVKVVAQAETAR